VTAGLLAGVVGLALLDALNPATIAGVALLLRAPMAYPVRAAAGFVTGAYLTVVGLGAVVYVGADGLVRMRRNAFTVAAVALAVTGLRARIRLGTLYERLGGERKQPRSVPIAAGYLVAAADVLTVAVLAWNAGQGGSVRAILLRFPCAPRTPRRGLRLWC